MISADVTVDRLPDEHPEWLGVLVTYPPHFRQLEDKRVPCLPRSSPEWIGAVGDVVSLRAIMFGLTIGHILAWAASANPVLAEAHAR